MLAHKLGHYPTRFHLDGEIPPSYGSGTFASRLERMHARGDTCKHLYQHAPKQIRVVVVLIENSVTEEELSRESSQEFLVID